MAVDAALQELTLRVDRVVAGLSHGLDRVLTVGQLATELGRSQEEILEALQARDGRSGVSLDTPGNGGDDRPALRDTLGSLDDGFSTAESHATLDSLMAGLSPRSLEMLRLRFEQDMTQAQIGERRLRQTRGVRNTIWLAGLQPHRPSPLPARRIPPQPLDETGGRDVGPTR